MLAWLLNGGAVKDTACITAGTRIRRTNTPIITVAMHLIAVSSGGCGPRTRS
jgi:hypothetical protein